VDAREGSPVEGVIFDIQTYAIYDGPGIRTTVFFKGCPLRCAWCQNPESQRLEPEIAWIRERCRRCGDCVAACPERALRLQDDGVRREDALCRRCGRCAETCRQRAVEVIGRRVSAEEVVRIVEQDRPFFEGSGGGVTLSGGEACLQEAFLLDLLDRFRARGIHTALSTCGFFPPALLERLASRVDLFLYDLKHADPEVHRQGTGATNDRILANFRALVRGAGSDRVLVRIPLVPGFNADPASLQAILDFAARAGYHGPVHLMPYNTLIRTKYGKLGREGDLVERPPQTDEDLARIVRQVEASGFEAVCNR